VRCEIFRDALSARIDCEQEPVSPGLVDRHLESCAACRAWYSDAQDLRRWMVVRAMPEVPDVTDVILDRIPAPSGKRRGARIGLGIVAVAQLALSVAQLLGAATGLGAMPGASMMGHLTHETGAWNLALGVGLLWAALRPRSAAGQLPLLTGFVLVLTALSVGDLLGHAVTAERLISHVFVVLGLALLFVVRHQHRDDRRPGTGDALISESRFEREPGVPDTPGERLPSHRKWHRPASRHRAA
jgi:predicted anti-sigma-YlaC factor YlaD